MAMDCTTEVAWGERQQIHKKQFWWRPETSSALCCHSWPELFGWNAVSSSQLSLLFSPIPSKVEADYKKSKQIVALKEY
jgi:hypothetical protein